MYRFAPSPTGDMHIGNLRVALFNYICAKQSNEKFILRIEDTDKQRNIDGKDEEIKEILTKFGIKWDKLYIQSDNLKFHREFAHKLLMDKKAFCCFCSQEELESKKELAKKENRPYRYEGACDNLSDKEVLNCEKPFVIRMKKPKRTIKYIDEIKGELNFSPEDIDNFVIMRFDKTPTYNFACAIDDMLMDITYIIRGEDHTSNTPKQEYIRKSLGYNKDIKYAHLPIILNKHGKKISKRDDSSSVKWLLEQGFLPEAIINYLILLGNKTPKEIFSLDEAIEWFDIKNLSKSPAKFDIKKLTQLNRDHIKITSNKRLVELFGLDEKYVNLIKFYTQEASLVPEIKDKVLKIYSKKEISDEFKNSAEILRNIIINMEIPNSFEEFKKEIMKLLNLKEENFFMPLRLLITGLDYGPELGELYQYIKDDIKEIVK
ncbi:glutamyl-tRNA synthetase [Campylobacter blaseri]|uniref:Glutamate--tRNA ligase n=1 Tax=Campylobacter blaseri TaxID=2042961 RepID=A0A2P8QZZ1_9BACT|nr:glutamate--tRNA ligase [Campylobacter blaseri]PSM51816.1 glutamate--tRNA ligase [Campylobacter blaseri]PSM53607.1 glutamate--tRNA ligase [Campylobacter blaseri]QKF86418.1 glutamyl-tRNA synthetase [Campylobacter blaseri]